jgi:hypothetical protein
MFMPIAEPPYKELELVATLKPVAQDGLHFVFELAFN